MFLSGKYLKLSDFVGNDEEFEILKNLLKGILKWRQVLDWHWWDRALRADWKFKKHSRIYQIF